MFRAKKLVSVSANFLSVTETSKKDDMVLKCVFYIYYLVQFKKNRKETQVQALIVSSSKVNAMIPAYASRLYLRVCHTNVRAQKIDGFIFQTFRMVLADFQVEDKLGRAWFFQETFLLANISVEVVLDMLFLILNNANIQSVEK